MIITSQEARQVLAGRKTQIRVPVRDKRQVTRTNGTSYDSTPFHPHIGRRVPFSVLQQIDGKQRAVPQCTVLVETYRHDFLDDSLKGPRPADAAADRAYDIVAVRAEGHKTTDEFKTTWVRRHDRPWINTQTQRLEIEPSDSMLLERFAKRHADTAVWVVTFCTDPVARDRYLARSPTALESDYTFQPELAARDEHPAVDELTQRRISDEGREYDALRAAGAAEEDLQVLRDIDATIGRLKVMGTRNGVNLRDQVRMQQQIRAGVERKIREQVSRRMQAAKAA